MFRFFLGAQPTGGPRAASTPFSPANKRRDAEAQRFGKWPLVLSPPRSPRLCVSKMRRPARIVDPSRNHGMLTSNRRMKSRASDFMRRSSGSSARRETPSAWARNTTSKSATQRDCSSIFARVSRLKSQPMRWQRAASAGCESPFCERIFRTCGPMMLRGPFKSCCFQHRTCVLSLPSNVPNSARFPRQHLDAALVPR